VYFIGILLSQIFASGSKLEPFLLINPLDFGRSFATSALSLRLTALSTDEDISMEER
jgi:hypothetical protein